MTRRRSGFSLIELLVVITVLLMLGGVLTLLLRLALETEAVQASSFDRLTQISRLADEFRADVASAEKTLPNWQDIQADDRTLILSLNDKTRIIYQWKDGKLRRSIFEPDDFSERIIPIKAKDLRIEFVQPARGEKVVRLHLHRVQDGQDSPGQTLEIAATLGGETR